MPQAILLQDVEQLGERGQVIDVSKGYLRNFLIPRKLAEPATKGSIDAARRRREAADRAVADAETKARESAELLNRTVLTIPHQAGEDGRLFGSVTSQDIADAMSCLRAALRRATSFRSKRGSNSGEAAQPADAPARS